MCKGNALYGLLLVAGIFGFSCNTENTKSSEQIPLYSTVCQPHLGGMFRGFTLGESIADFVGKNPDLDTRNIGSGFSKRYDISWKETAQSLEVFYTFDSYGLYEIQADLYIDDKDDTKEAFSIFQTYFDSLYGASACEGGTCLWTTFSISNLVVEVSLSIESVDSNSSFISINFLEPLTDEI